VEVEDLTFQEAAELRDMAEETIGLGSSREIVSERWDYGAMNISKED